MLIFMVCFFGYMDYMILYKWVTPLDTPPSLINSLIAMAMRQPDNAPLFDGSIELEGKLMMAAMISVPWLLIPKPFILWLQHKMSSKNKKKNDYAELPVTVAGGDTGGDVDTRGGSCHEEEPFEMGEIIIHQVIETIEYVLGTVSHTASYLRQWALSLAHQQLSLVFFQKTLTIGFNSPWPNNAIILYITFAIWLAITFGVLLGMDVLECFLHTLRLHWVEFQSKFYKADGYLFAPFRISKLLQKEES